LIFFAGGVISVVVDGSQAGAVEIGIAGGYLG